MASTIRPKHLPRQHLVLLQYPQVSEAVEAGTYDLHSDLEHLAQGHPASEDFLLTLQDMGKFKEACKFLAATLHRRVSVWWGYQCVLDLLEETKAHPAPAPDLMELAAPGSIEQPLPDWAKVPPPPQPLDVEAELRKVMAPIDQLEQELEKIPPGPRMMFNSIRQTIDQILKDKVGMDSRALCEGLARRALESRDTPLIDLKNSPITKATDEIRARIESIRKEALRTVKDALPTPDPRLLAQRKGSALDCVYSYIAAPNDEQARRCMDMGNEIPDQPEGLLALCAFWSFGNLTPGGKEVIKAPSKLLCRGMDSLLLTCGLAKGGTRKLNERLERYLELGIAAATGESNWGESVEHNLVPHHHLDPGEGSAAATASHRRFRIR
ncbi:MAG: hypothetical protein K6A65_02490 [Succinivibrionaceae bacterium]|nr:hypothetical protein [Succinivibrionaceae bacterium]